MERTSTPGRASVGIDLPQQRGSASAEVGLHAGRVLVADGDNYQPRTRQGERLDHLFEERRDWIQQHGPPGHLAVDADGLALTFDELDARANQLARYLLAQGARAGDRIALLFDQPVQSYLGMLAVLKINATYVPLDAGFPAERLSYIVSDARARMVLSLASVRARVGDLAELGAEPIWIDEAAGPIARHASSRLSSAERGEPVDELAYIIYTSGSTGRPKGVAITHPSICNFVRVAADVYGLRLQDRVYQGMTIAFDFSVEEIWVPWMVGATLIPKPAGASLLGQELHEFLSERRVTALCCVPTLLATIEDELPALRFLLVSGEACPQDLIARWHHPARRFLNVYGPTETTVTATWTVLHPDRPVTIGIPLPSYAVAILDPEDPFRVLPPGEIGEIGIAGAGLAAGYVNREDLTDNVFLPDFLDIPGNTSGRIYRSGDLGRINNDGEIEYHGRIDLQVKICGYRIELTEIESVLLRLPGIGAAVVGTYSPQPDVVELVGYYSARGDATSIDPEMILSELREQLPAYMVPAYLEQLDVIPLTTNGKVDRKSLPAPTARRAPVPGPHDAPATATEQLLAELLARILNMDQVPVTSHFFDELGASSLAMTRFAAQVRKQADLPTISIRHIYQHSSVRALAGMLDATVATGQTARRDRTVPPDRADAPVASYRAGTLGHLASGAAQLLAFLALAFLGGLLLDRGFRWVSAGTGAVEIYQRAATFGVATFAGLCALPVVAKWALVGRWKPTEIRLWSPAYLRFWVVKVLIRTSPMTLFVGSPLYILYLRALGAKIGTGVSIFSSAIPVATDLLSIGAGTVIRQDSAFTGYRVVPGRLQTGRVTLGANVLVGERTALDIGTSMGDWSQLGHSSALHAGQSVPPGQAWHGSPAQPAGVTYRTVPLARCGPARRIIYSLLQLLALLVLGTAAVTVLVIALTRIPALAALLGPDMFLGSWGFYLAAAITSVGLYLAALLGVLVVMLTLPRVMSPMITAGRVYPLYGFRFIVQRLITRLSNSRFFMLLFGDSSYIVHFVRGLGYDLSRVEQTGSNFGTQLRHDSPFLTTVGTGTMVSDGLSIINTDYSSTSFRVSAVTVGARNFVGNDVAFPAGACTGENCLLATRVMIPIEGPVRHDVGLLGSPPFEIPRTTRRDDAPGHPSTPAELRRRLAAKNRYNAGTIGTVLLLRSIGLFAGLLVLAIAADLWAQLGAFALATALFVIPLVLIVYSALLERVVLGFRRLTPQYCSIYDRYFWSHERLWKFYVSPPLPGTPFQSLIWRLAGLRIGRRVFDDGCVIPEKTLVTIGDDTVLNAGSVIQCHSLEEGYFQSDYTSIGARVSIGVKAFVHYGVTMGDGAILDADSFVLKGEEIFSNTHWRGNPASERLP